MKSIEPASMTGDRPAAERHVMTLVVLVATVLVARVLGLYIRHIYDDAFITFRYAKNLAAGHGFVFNVGERVLGTTAPLWGLVLALFAWARVPLTTLVPVLNALLDCVTVLLVLFYCRRRNWLLPALFFAVMFAGDPNMVRIPVGGMETSLLLVLCVWALVLFDNGRRIVAAVLVAVCYFLRPESLLLLGLLLVLTAQERRWRELALMAGLSVLVVGIPLGLIWAYYGSPIAHSVAAKSSGLNGRLLPVLKEELAVNPVHLLVLPLAVWGATRVVHQRGLARHSLIWGAVYGAVFLLLRPPVWGWYFVPLYFAKFLLAGFGIADIVGRIRGLSRVSVRAWALAGSGLVLLTGVAIAVKTGPAPVRRNVYEPLRDWFRQHPADGAKIAAGDIGAIGFYSNAYICDMAGLVMPKPKACGGVPNAVRVWQPDYLFLVACRDEAGALLSASEVAARYRPVARFSKTAQQNLFPGLDELHPRWLQDYILYQRVADSVP